MERVPLDRGGSDPVAARGVPRHATRSQMLAEVMAAMLAEQSGDT